MVRFTTNRPICLYTKELFDISRHTLSKSENLNHKSICYMDQDDKIWHNQYAPQCLYTKENLLRTLVIDVLSTLSLD